MAPRGNLSPAAKQALAYWGVIELAAEVHATTADLWGWIRDEADRLGLSSPGVSARGVSELRGRAGQIQEAARKFGNLTDGTRVRGVHVAIPPWARDPDARKALPKFAVRFKHTTLVNGVSTVTWRTSVFPGKINHTAGQLRRAVELDAVNLAEKYGSEHVGIEGLQVLVF